MRKKIDCAETECCDCIEIHGECIKKVIERMPAEVTLIDLAALFKVFGDPTRVKLLYVLRPVITPGHTRLIGHHHQTVSRRF